MFKAPLIKKRSTKAELMNIVEELSSQIARQAKELDALKKKVTLLESRTNHMVNCFATIVSMS